MRKFLTALLMLCLPVWLSAQTLIGPSVMIGPQVIIGAASFPLTGILDNFTRANENPLSDGGKWTNNVPFGSGNLALVSDTATSATSSGGEAVWNASTFGPDVEVYANLITPLPLSGNCISFSWRLNLSGPTGYLGQWCNASGWHIYSFIGGVFSSSLGDNASAIVAGDSIGFSMVGSTITAYREHSGIWSPVYTATDSSVTAAGNIYLLLDDNTETIGAFGGGTIP